MREFQLSRFEHFLQQFISVLHNSNFFSWDTTSVHRTITHPRTPVTVIAGHYLQEVYWLPVWGNVFSFLMGNYVIEMNAGGNLFREPV